MNVRHTGRPGLVHAAVLVAALVVAPAVCAATPAEPTVPAAAPAGALPPMGFAASVLADELYAELKKSPSFARLDKELIGSAVNVRVTHSMLPTAAGQASALGSAIWSGGTLGLLPMVTNNDLVMTYEVLVHGEPLAKYQYQRNFTAAVNLWKVGADPLQGLGAEGVTWVKGTVAQFLAAAATDPKLAALREEFEFYFGPG